MTLKSLQNTYEEAQPKGCKNGKLFHKCDASIPPHSNLTQ